MSHRALLLQLEPSSSSFSWLDEWARNDPESLGGSMAVVGVAFAVALYATVKLWARHRERLAMIEKGLHPDAVEKGESADA